MGIIGGFYLAAASYKRDTRSRDKSDLLSLLEQHRELWNSLHRQPELNRILLHDVDFLEKPITTAESEFLNLVFVHYHTGWLLAKQGLGNSLKTLSKDAKDFLSLPLPRCAWNYTKETRDPAFVTFVERAISGEKSKWWQFWQV